jgi:hypothetical protein
VTSDHFQLIEHLKNTLALILFLSMPFECFSNVLFFFLVSRKQANNLFINLLLMQERFYFGDQVLPLFVTGIPLLKQRLHQLPESDKVCSTRMF